MAEQDRSRIIVGVDGSPMSVGALRWAVQQARRTGAEVHAVTGWDVPITIYLAPTYTEADYQRDAEQVLNRVVDEVMAENADVPVHRHLVEKAPALALTHAAEEAVLLVIGSHGHRHLREIRELHLGSVASYCVHHAPCPVLVYREAATGG